MCKLFNHVDDTERRLVKNMISAGISWSQVQKVTGRSRDTIHSILKPRRGLCKKGAPAKLSSHDVAKILKVAEAMIKKADAQKSELVRRLTLSIPFLENQKRYQR